MSNRRERRQNQRQGEDTLIDLVEARESAQGFVEKNQKTILGVAALIVLVVAAIIIYNALVRQPKLESAKAEIHKAEIQFNRDSFALALTNPGAGYDGFLGIIENYGNTPTGNTAKFYAGVSYLQLGDYDNAIKYLEQVNAKGEILSSQKYGNLGDAYSEKGQFEEAADQYRKAVTNGQNEALQAFYLMKLGRLSERLGNKDEALKSYKEIRDNYAETPEADKVDKYIIRLES